jgi:hypothetical protein
MNVTRSLKPLALAALACALAVGASASAAPIWLQDYEAPGNLDAPFNLQPDSSGSTRGILDQAAPNNAGTSTIALDAADGALSTVQSAELNIVDNPAQAGGIAGTTYTIRHIPNSGANVTATNPAFPTDGYVGFYLKADPSAAAALLEVAPLLEDSGGTLAGSGGVLRPVIADGQWHRYQWNMDDPADFPNTFESFYGGTVAAETLEATASFDSIAIISRGPEGQSSVILNIDQIGYDNLGQLPEQIVIPEPATLALAGLALAVAGAVRRRIA